MAQKISYETIYKFETVGSIRELRVSNNCYYGVFIDKESNCSFNMFTCDTIKEALSLFFGKISHFANHVMKGL